jgi:N-acylneuraminate cytidylyltransferase
LNNSKEIIAIIPARGGSKSIPKKNIKLLSGNPLIAYTIENAKNSRSINRVVVSTDDDEIAQVSKKYGAEIVWRPSELSGDTAASEDALLHTLSHYEKSVGYFPEILVFLQCTSPLTLPEDINGTIKALVDENADSALAVSPFHYYLWEKSSDGNANGINHDKSVRHMRQDRKPQYIETGAIYVMRVDGFKKTGHRFFGKTVMYVMPPERCLEIDDPFDLEIAEFLLKKNRTLQKDSVVIRKH